MSQTNKIIFLPRGLSPQAFRSISRIDTNEDFEKPLKISKNQFAIFKEYLNRPLHLEVNRNPPMFSPGLFLAW